MGIQKIISTEHSKNMRKGSEKIKMIKVTNPRAIHIPSPLIIIAEYWIGLKNLSRYTNEKCHWELNITGMFYSLKQLSTEYFCSTVWDFNGTMSSGHYSRFFIHKGK